MSSSELRVEEFLPGPVRLRLEPVLRFQRYRSVEQVQPAIREVAEAMLAEAAALAAPRVAWLRRPIETVGPDGATLADGPTFHGRCLGTHLAGATAAVAFVATVGPALDARVEAMADGMDLLEALFLDTAGWLAIEETVLAFRRHLAGLLRPEKLRLSPRLGPGYLDWPLEEQAAFFTLFGGQALPVSLSEHCVMTPKKSVSGLFGLHPRGGRAD